MLYIVLHSVGVVNRGSIRLETFWGGAMLGLMGVTASR